ncbi:MAG: hypothetical protein AAGF07_02345 [Patescibacteria group bacterium]
MTSLEIYNKISQTVKKERDEGKDCVLLILDRYALVQIPQDSIVKEESETNDNLHCKGSIVLQNGIEINFECQKIGGREITFLKDLTRQRFRANFGTWGTFDSERNLIP